MLAAAGVPGNVIVFKQARCFVDVLPREVTAASEGHEFKSILLLGRTRRPNEQPDRLLDNPTHRRSRRRRSIFELFEQLIVQRDCGAHDA